MSRIALSEAARNNERQFPRIVELPVPNGGFGALMAAFAAFHQERSVVEHRGRGSQRDGKYYIRWCFETSELAEAFMAVFGGRRLINDSRFGPQPIT